MDTIWFYRCLIVPAAHVQFARDLCAAVAGPAGAGMFSAPLSPTGQEPATHWISAGLISEDFARLLPLTTYPADAEPVHTPGHPEIVARIATSNGYPTTAAEVAQLLDAADITEQEAHEVMARLGPQMVQPTEPANGI